MAGTIDSALNLYGNALRGTASQRAAFLSTAADGMLWQDTDGIRMIWRKDGALWVPAVMRWRGTTAQMNSFGANAPDGFEWFSTTDNSDHVRLGGAWVKGDNTVQTTTNAYLSVTSASFQNTPLTGTIKPSSTSSKVLITASFVVGTQAAGGNGIISLFRGNVSGANLGNGLNGMSQVWAGSSTFRTGVTLSFLDSPSTTSSQLYTVGLRAASGVVDFIPASTLATMILKEVR